ncbi:MAG: response regulator, partial [Deltaproteobacteria bacterium]|nr:response regulator [Deltaproteobacteria bacterium]
MITPDSKNILLADDSAFFRAKLGETISEAGHTLRFATDGREVIEMIEKDPDWPDLIILDLQMPNVDGFTVVEWIKNNGLEDKLPVLIITGAYEPQEIVDKLHLHGAKGLMSKGFTPEQIVHRIHSLLFDNHEIKRENPRIPVSTSCEYKVKETMYSGYILNISMGGVYLNTKMDLPDNTVLELTFTLPTSTDPINVRGLVQWHTPGSAEKNLFGGAGICFSDLTNDDMKKIRSYVSDELKKSILY